QEIRDALPDSFRPATVKYDSLMRRLAEMVSRYIDRHCHQPFFPTLATRYYDAKGRNYQWIDDLMGEDPLIEVSSDNGSTYTALAATDYFLLRADDYNTLKTFNKLVTNVPAGNYPVFYSGQRSLKITDIWCHHDDRANAWEDSIDAVLDNPLAAGAVTVTVTDADGATGWGYTPRFAVGQLIRIDSEYCEIGVVNTVANTLTVVRGRNGTTDVQHLVNTQIDIWRPPHPVKMAAIIQAVRQMERGFQGFGDARATPEIGQLFFIKALDPEAQILLVPYRKIAVG
ncbi:MAG: hypothetical protein KAJ19_13065, partial [Gammaproteobacteria bacterium]|nr:hypothetical protein [Gammaproteobacteria bacterium]